MATVLILQFEETDSREKAADRLVKLWGETVLGPTPGYCLLAVTDVCVDLDKAKEICRLYGGKPVTPG